MPDLKTYLADMLPIVEDAMQQITRHTVGSDAGLSELHSMLAFHMGWEGEGAGPEARGKRIRPLILLISCAAAGGAWRAAVPAAAAVELVHNFSLIHDDIEDNSPLRRGRPTVWSQWGIPQAINAGDSLLSIAHLSIFDLAETCSPAVALEAARLLQRTCLELTQGQYLDMAFESQASVSLNTYWQMISGKTAALLAACCEIGALCAQTDPKANPARGFFHTFGQKLGLAFQAQDDILGIWGDVNDTGKSTQSDLIERKKSLPILYGLQNQGAFAKRWQSEINSSDISELARMLEKEGALSYTQQAAKDLTKEAVDALQHLRTTARTAEQHAAGQALFELTHGLINRQK